MTAAVPPVPPAAPAAAVAPVRRRRVWDIVITIVLLVVPPVALILSALFDAFLVFGGADSPNDTESAQSLAFFVLVACVGLAIVGTVVSIIMLVRRRRAWWIALVTALVVCGACFLSLDNWTTVIG